MSQVVEMATTFIIEVLNVTIEVIREQSLGVVFRAIGSLYHKAQDFVYGVNYSELEIITNLEGEDASEGSSREAVEKEQPSGKETPFCSINLFVVFSLFFSCDVPGICRKHLFMVDESLCFLRADLPPLDGSALSVYDSFWPVNGVPMFELKRDEFERDLESGSDADGVLDCEVSERENNLDDDAWAVTVCHFSTNGSRMISGHADGSLRLWDADHGRLMLCRKKIHKFPVADVAFW